jgi:hypothetical protein
MQRARPWPSGTARSDVARSTLAWSNIAGALFVLAAALAPLPAVAIDLATPNGGRYALRVTSLKEARFGTTIPQRYDFSCGSAATATLLTFQYGTPVSEEEVFARMYRSGDQGRIRAEGFSLLDMQRFLAEQGFQADGFELPLDELMREGLPAIVLLNDRGYRHFVVIKGIENGRILIGDPARGTRAMPLSRFRALWDNDVLFVVHNRRERARFNHPDDWRTAPPAPLRDGVGRRALHDVVISKYGPGDI